MLSVRVRVAAGSTGVTRRTGWPAGGSNAAPTAGLTTPGASVYTTATQPDSGDDRTRTGGLSPDKRVLCRLSYAPV